MPALALEPIVTGSGPGRQEGSGSPPLVLAHGFTQTGRLWGRFGPALASGRPVVGVDLPGHGGSGDVRADLVHGATLLVAAARAAAEAAGGTGPAGGGTGPAGGGTGPAAADTAGSPVDLLGYSLGARLALHAALQHPSAVRRLVLIGGTGGLEDPDARARRRAADEAMAEQLEAEGDVAGFVTRWLARPMFAGLDDRDGRTERQRNTASGLASSLRLAGLGTQQPLWGQLGGLAMPVLVMAGADDPRFVAHGVRLAGAAPQAVLALVPGAGHAAHLHRPALAARLVGHWLDHG